MLASRWLPWAAGVLLLLSPHPVSGDPVSAGPLPGLALADRVDTALRSRGAALRRSNLAHWALISEVAQEDLARAMAPVWAWPDGGGFVLGAGNTVEYHGGGILDLLFAHWRPEGRAARPSDRFRFLGAEVALGAIYAGHKRQVFLPVNRGSPSGEPGALPEAPRLPRMLFVPELEGVEPTERDAYSLLRLLVAREPVGAQSWINRQGQELSVDLLLGHAWRRYLGGPEDPEEDGESKDHSWLHLPEILLAYEHRVHAESGVRPGLDPNDVKHRFLVVELARALSATDDERVGHYVESLGWLVAHPRLDWTEDEKAGVRAWLRELEEGRFSDLADVETIYLAHVARGLHMLRAHGEVLGLDPARP